MKNTTKHNLRFSAIYIGAIALFAINSAMADEDEIKALTQPKSSVQVEVINVDNSSAKFGEYNGLYGHNSGVYPNAAVNIRGGNAYTNNQQGETSRWSVTGENLGLTSRSANVSAADQGAWSLGVNFDQLQHNMTDTYQTPYQGKMGGNSFTLPSNFYNNANAIVNSGGSATVRAGTQSMPGQILGDFQGMNISSTRDNTTVNGSAQIDKDSNVFFEYNNLIQSGAKLSPISATQVVGIPSALGGVAKATVFLPMPTNSQTDTVSFGYNWKGENAHFTASYFGSFFQNNASNFQWAPAQAYAPSYAVNNTMQTISTMPNNALNQLNLAGGYDFSKKTKLTANFSVSNNTQNQGFGGTYDQINYMGTPPANSLNGVVNTTHADFKVADQTIKDLTLTAGAKFDQRDNLTQSNLYYPIAVSTESGVTANAPLSIKQSQLLLGADYRLTKDQKLSLTLGNSSINRWCNQYGSQNTTAGTYYYNSANCVTATSSNENKADLSYKLKANEDLSFRMGAGYANRKSNFNNSVYTAIPGEPYDTTNPLKAVNASDVAGYYPFFEASRKQYSTKASASWQATQDLSLTIGGKYLNDLFYDSTLGVQNANVWSLNFDSTYAYDEQGTASVYVTQQSQQRNLSSGKTAATGWSNNLQTNSTTLGVGFKQGGLLNGKVGLSGDANYSVANSVYNTVGVPAYTATCSAAATATCGVLPGIYNNTLIFKLGSTYQLDKNSKIGVGYWYQRLRSNDFYYNTIQYGWTPGVVMPTNQTSPSYNVNVISANYTYTFD